MNAVAGSESPLTVSIVPWHCQRDSETEKNITITQSNTAKAKKAEITFAVRFILISKVVLTGAARFIAQLLVVRRVRGFRGFHREGGKYP